MTEVTEESRKLALGCGLCAVVGRVCIGQEHCRDAVLSELELEVVLGLNRHQVYYLVKQKLIVNRGTKRNLLCRWSEVRQGLLERGGARGEYLVGLADGRLRAAVLHGERNGGPDIPARNGKTRGKGKK